jgi:hypothetical protein
LNEILLKRICKLIAITKGVSEPIVWQLFTETNSIDKVLAILEEEERVKYSP